MEEEKWLQEEWLCDIDKDALDRAVKAGEILPRLELPEVGSSVVVKVVSVPTKIIAERLPTGEAFAMNVEYPVGSKKYRNMIAPKSLRFNLAKVMRQHEHTSPVGLIVEIGANVADAGGRTDAKVYWCRYEGYEQVNFDEVPAPPRDIEPRPEEPEESDIE